MATVSAEINSAIKQAIRAEVGPDHFAAWFEPLRVDQIDEEVAEVSVPTQFLRHRIDTKYKGQVLAACQSAAPAVSQVRVRVRRVEKVVLKPPVVKEVAPPPKPISILAHKVPGFRLLYLCVYDVPYGPYLPSLLVESIQQLVATFYDIPVCELLTKNRAFIREDKKKVDLLRPREHAVYLCSKLTPLSMVTIGRRFGGRDHTTVLHMVAKVAWLIGERTHPPARALRLLRKRQIDIYRQKEIECLTRQLKLMRKRPTLA